VIDHGVYGSRHLGRDCGVGLAAQMSVVSILRDVAFELVPEAVGPLENSGLAGHPERAPEPGIAVLRDPRLADAIVLGRTRQDDTRVAYLMEAGFPFVTFGRTRWEREHPWVEIDYGRAGEVAVEALAAAKPNELHILSAPEGLRFADNYVTGAKRAALRLGLANVHTHRIEMTEAMGEETAMGLLKPGGRVALACIQDSLAFGVFRAAAKLGVKLGDDAAVFGGQNFPGSEHTAPPLSTFSTEDSRVAALLSDIMLIRLDGPHNDGDLEGQVIEPRALLRGSHLLTP
jgi:LacI family transcriptional regulator